MEKNEDAQSMINIHWYISNQILIQKRNSKYYLLMVQLVVQPLFENNRISAN